MWMAKLSGGGIGVTKRNPITEFDSKLAEATACSLHPPLRKPESVEEAELWRDTIEHCSPSARRQHLRWFAQHDLYFLLVFILHRWHLLGDQDPYVAGEAAHIREQRRLKRATLTAQWCLDRCREYEENRWNHLDLWSRESFKSEIVTFGGNIQSIINDPNETIGILSHSRPIAKQFLKQIKRELENNGELKELFPEIFYSDPEKQSPQWGEDVGIVCKRTTNRKEATVEAWGLVDGQPTSKRFTILSYDDPIGRQEITPIMSAKVAEEFRNSLLLSATPLHGSDGMHFRYCSTFQELGDLNQTLIDEGQYLPRIRSTIDEQGRSLCHSDARMAALRDGLTRKEWALQILLDPSKARDDSIMGFRLEWVQRYDRDQLNLNSLNKYIFVDPAGETDTTHSHYVLSVIGYAPDKRKKLLAIAYDKLNLQQRTEVLRDFCRTWTPNRIFYEKQAMQGDIEHIRGEMRRELWEVDIIPVGTNRVDKDKRIEWLIPEFQTGFLQVPKQGILYRAKSPDLYRQLKLPQLSEFDVLRVFYEREFLKWPNTPFKDILDCLSWCKWDEIQVHLPFPRPWGDRESKTGEWGVGERGFGSGGWMSE